MNYPVQVSVLESKGQPSLLLPERLRETVRVVPVVVLLHRESGGLGEQGRRVSLQPVALHVQVVRAVAAAAAERGPLRRARPRELQFSWRLIQGDHSRQLKPLIDF